VYKSHRECRLDSEDVHLKKRKERGGDLGQKDASDGSEITDTGDHHSLSSQERGSRRDSLKGRKIGGKKKAQRKGKSSSQG